MPARVVDHPGLPPDVWYLVFESLGVSGCRDTLYDACLVCKDFHYLATPALYSSIWLGATHAAGERRLADLLRFLAHEGNSRIRAAIRQVTIAQTTSLDCLQSVFRLVRSLPSLQTLIIQSSMDIPIGLLKDLRTRPRRPEVHLLDQDGTRESPTVLPAVTRLHAVIDPHAGINSSPNDRILNVQSMFFACSDLRSFSLTVKGPKDNDPLLRGLMFPSIFNFRLTGDEVFPPITELSLNGYQPSAIEWPHWRDGFAWSKLTSLTLENSPDMVMTLAGITGLTRSLQRLTLTCDNRVLQIPTEIVDRFMLSFHTLTHLTLNGHFCSSRALANHPDLTSVWIENPLDFLSGTLDALAGWNHLNTFTASDLSHLDSHCRKLETLGIDILPEDSQWTSEVLTTLRLRFSNLRRLDLHLPLGLPNYDPDRFVTLMSWTLPAYEVGSRLLAMRPLGRLRKLTLRIGDPFHRQDIMSFPIGGCLRRYTDQDLVQTTRFQGGKLVITQPRRGLLEEQ